MLVQTLAQTSPYNLKRSSVSLQNQLQHQSTCPPFATTSLSKRSRPKSSELAAKGENGGERILDAIVREDIRLIMEGLKGNLITFCTSFEQLPIQCNEQKQNAAMIMTDADGQFQTESDFSPVLSRSDEDSADKYAAMFDKLYNDLSLYGLTAVRSKVRTVREAFDAASVIQVYRLDDRDSQSFGSLHVSCRLELELTSRQNPHSHFRTFATLGLLTCEVKATTEAARLQPGESD